MSKSGGISGTSVAVITAGAVVAYAGFRGVSPLEVLRTLSTGKLPAVPNRPGTTGLLGTSSILGTITAGAHPEFVAAAMHYQSDRYSEFLRNVPGYSDCSSFVSKAMRDCGVGDAFLAGWPRTTITLKSWSSMHQIDTASMAAGDLAISDTDGAAAHVVMVTGAGGSAIGQQNSRDNVKTGTIEQLLTVPYHIYRYGGTGSSGSSTTHAPVPAGPPPNIASV